MASEQSAGGGVESNRRHVRPNGDSDAMPENESKAAMNPTAEQSEQVSYDDRIGQLPRRYSTPAAAPPPPPPSGQATALLRNPPATSSISAPGPAAPELHVSSPAAGSGLGLGAAQLLLLPQPPPLEPPVTKATLSELDVNKILMNPKLRHDINFDPELHFRPNMDGEKGRRKAEKANQFWSTLHAQLQLFVTDRPAFVAEHGSGDWCLPVLLRAVKDIIQTLVPVRDRAYLDEGLDVDLLMQQFDKGIADLEKLASWLSQVLKSHCAPMRDEWVDEMYGQLSGGNRNNDLQQLVKGMRNLLNVLEAMKLDVANHQIRCLRPVLIEDTVHFEQKYHAKRMRQHRMKMDTAEAAAWYRGAIASFSGAAGPRRDFGEMAVFFEAFARLMMPSVDASRIGRLLVFQFDEDRIGKLRTDLLDAINLEVCMRVWEELESRYGRAAPPAAADVALAAVSDEDRAMLSWSQEMGLTGTFSHSLLQAPSAASSCHGGSRPSSLVYSDAGSMSSSPRSSVVFPPAPSRAGDSCTLLLSSSSSSSPPPPPPDARARSISLYSALMALVQTAPAAPRHTSRWQALAPDMALQILRSTSASLDLLPAFEVELASHLCDTGSVLWQEVEAQFHARLMAELMRKVSEFKNLAAVNLFAVATVARAAAAAAGQQGTAATKTWDGRDRDLSGDGQLGRAGGGSAGPREPREEAGLDDVATRVAHVGILHWRVWSAILYNHCTESPQPQAAPLPPPPQ